MSDHEAEIAHCPIFEEMDPDECRLVTSLAECVEYKAGETILREGRSIQMLWILLEGDGEVVKTIQNGREQQLAVLEPGALFGEMSFFQLAPHSATVRALTGVKVLRLPYEKFEQLERSHPQVAFKIAAGTARILAQRLRRMNDWVNDFVQRPETGNHREELQEFRAKLLADWSF